MKSSSRRTAIVTLVALFALTLPASFAVAGPSDGVATVAVPPGHRGANRTYEAIFEGDEFYRASSDRRPGRAGGHADDAGGSTHQSSRSYRDGVFPL